ncbi:MAG: tetratricopeptide repeat protein, partial [Myxococcota bacterium]
LVIGRAERPEVSVLRLGPLGPADHEQLVQEALHLDLSLALRLATHTAGNPGFAVSLLRELVATDTLVPGEAGFRLRPGATLAPSSDTVTSWRRRVDAVVKGLRERQDLWLAAIQRSLPLDTPARRALAERAARAGLASVHDGALVIRSAALQDVLLAEARAAGAGPELHRRALEQWLHDPGDPASWERQAQLAEGAEAPERALEAWLEAGSALRRTGGRFRRKHRAATSAWAHVEGLGLPVSDRRHGRALGLLVHSMLKGRGDPEQIAQCEALLAAAEAHGWPDLEFEARLYLGISLVGTERADDAVPQMVAAGNVAAEAGLHDRAVASWSQLGHHHSNLGQLDVAAGWFTRCIETAERLDDPAWGSVRGHCGLARIAQQRGQWSEALEHAHAAVAASEGTNPQFRAFAAAVLGNALVALDRSTEAEPWVRQSLDYARRSGARQDECRYLATLVAIHRSRGELGEAEGMLRRALHIAERVGGARFELRLELGLVRVLAGDWPDAGATVAPERLPERPGSAQQVTIELMRLGAALAIGSVSDAAERVRALAETLETAELASPDCLTVAEALRDRVTDPAVREPLERLVRVQRERLG